LADGEASDAVVMTDHRAVRRHDLPGLQRIGPQAANDLGIRPDGTKQMS